MRPVVRTLIAVLLAGCCAVLATTAAAASVRQASAQRVQQRSSGTSLADSHPLTLSVDSVSPQFATSTKTITVSGTLSNHTGSAIPGMAVQLQSYPSAFATRSDMNTYASGGTLALPAGQVTLLPVGLPDMLSAPLADGATTRWTVSFDLAKYREVNGYGYYSGFGVYPLQVQATSTASSHQAVVRTLLPYWPGTGGIGKHLQVAWIWPLIDTPQQGACPQDLATSTLTGSLAAGGRLSTLLGTSAQWAARDHLTWAIDPALLSDATVMTRPYSTQGNSTCTGGRIAHPASAAAASWLAQARAATAGASAFATPYADVDVSALSHAGLDPSLRSAYQVGDATASQLLPGTFGATGTRTGGGSGGKAGPALAAAWPAGGTADAGVLTSLASDGGIKTVVLSSDELPTKAPYYDNALARTRASSGTSMSVLLADSKITGILGSTSVKSSGAAQFAVTQDFLAQTAMILAENPNLSRALVVAPPAGWNPSAAEATNLLRLTKAAPWLLATGLGPLAARASTAALSRLRATQVSKGELSDAYTDQLESLSVSVSTFESLLYRPPAAYLAVLDAATAVTESSAWRGPGSPGGWLAEIKLSDFLAKQQGKVRIIASRKVLLAGTSGTTPVSVTNGLNRQVRVLVKASTPVGSTLRVGSGSFERLLVVNPRKTQTVPLPMNSSSIGTTTLRLQLLTSDGTPLTWPGASASMSVEVTRFGRTLLVIIVAALGVLLLTSVVRLRRKRHTSGERGDGGDRDFDQAEKRAHAGGAG